MSANILKHPKRTKVHARYGFDRALGFFVTVFDGERVVAEYDRTRPGYDDLNGVLRVLVAHGLAEPNDIDEAIALSRTHDCADMPAAIARVARVIDNLRKGADPE
jgi:hypothetical protein